MARLILIICAVGAVWLLLHRVMQKRHGSRKRDEPKAFAPTVRCHICGAYLDRRLARHDDAGYCCQSHDKST